MEIYNKLQHQKNTEELGKVDGNCMNIEYPDIKLGYEGGKELLSSKSLENMITIMNRNMYILRSKYPNSF